MKTFLCRALLMLATHINLGYAKDCDPTITTASGRFAPELPFCKGQLIFEENFDTIDPDLWTHDVNMWGGGVSALNFKANFHEFIDWLAISYEKNGEFQWYTADTKNSDSDNGVLDIKPTLTTDVIPDLTNCHIVLDNCTIACERDCTVDNIAPPIQSARLTTVDAFSFKYGQVEIRAKLPTGDWLWPALWLLPQQWIYGLWPMSGEIDIMESRGNTDYKPGDKQIGVEEFGMTLHFGTVVGYSAWWSAHFETNTAPGDGLNKDYHLYQMGWTPDVISFSLDNNLIGNIETGDGFYARGKFTGDNPWINGGLNAPFDQEFYFILNVAIGGTNGFFPEDGNAGGKPWRNDAPYAARDFWNGRDEWMGGWNFDPSNPVSSSMQIDYIRVYAL